MKVIILAAGMATRFGAYLEGRPKCLLELLGTSILERQIALFRKCGIQDIVIVKGYSPDSITVPGARYYLNSEFRETNMVHSLFCAQPELYGDVVISYADILCDRNSVGAVLSCKGHPITVAVDVDWEKYYGSRYEDAFSEAESLVTDPTGDILEIGESNPARNRVQGQYIGLIKLDERGAQLFVSYYQRFVQESGGETWFRGRSFRKAFMTDFLQALIDRGVSIHAAPIHNGWLEFDSPSDYEKVLGWIKTKEIDRFCELA